MLFLPWFSPRPADSTTSRSRPGRDGLAGRRRLRRAAVAVEPLEGRALLSRLSIQQPAYAVGMAEIGGDKQSRSVPWPTTSIRTIWRGPMRPRNGGSTPARRSFTGITRTTTRTST